MTSTPRLRAARVAAPVAALLLLAPLTGCTQIVDAMRGEATLEFASPKELGDEWAKDAPWVPADATDIMTRETTDDDAASLIAVSGTALDPAQCVEVDRQSAPMLALPGTPDIYTIDRVFACGDWTVAAVDHGWYGWTPNHPDEKAQTPVS